MEYRVITTKLPKRNEKPYIESTFEHFAVATDELELSLEALSSCYERFRRYSSHTPKSLMVRVSLSGLPQGIESGTDHLNQWLLLMQMRVNSWVGENETSKPSCKLTAFSKLEDQELGGPCFRVAVLFNLAVLGEDNLIALRQRIEDAVRATWSQVTNQGREEGQGFVTINDHQNFIILDKQTEQGQFNRQVAFKYLSQLTELNVRGRFIQRSTFQTHRTRLNSSSTRTYPKPIWLKISQ